MNSSITLRATTVATASALLLALCLPLSSHAQLISQGNFCNNMDGVRARAMERHTERVNAYAAKRADLEASYMARKTERLAQFEETRTKADTLRTTRYTQLEGLAKTEAHRAAVAAFRTEIEDAVTARRASIDEAIETFEATTRNMWQEREQNRAAFASDLGNQLAAAFAEARAQCASEEPGAVREQLRASLEGLSTSFQEHARTMASTGELQAARDALRTATEEAMKTFRVRAEAATQTLRDALSA